MFNLEPIMVPAFVVAVLNFLGWIAPGVGFTITFVLAMAKLIEWQKERDG